MDKLIESLRHHLEEKLPVSASDALHAPERFQHYYDSPVLARLALETDYSGLFPWALHTRFTQINAKFDPGDKGSYSISLEELGKDFGLFAYPTMLIPQIIGRAFAQWNHQIDVFYTKDCLQTSADAALEQSKCARSTSRLSAQDPLYLSPDCRQLDAVKLMAPRIRELSAKIAANKSPYDRWCVLCANTLKSTVEKIVLEIHPCLVQCVAAVIKPTDLCGLQ